MAFNVISQASSQINQPPTGKAAETQSAAQTARERAIARLTGTTPPQMNQNQVAPEEAAVVSPSVKTEESTGQVDTNEAPPASEASSEEVSSDAADTVAPPEEAPGKKDPLSVQYAQLAKKEKALRMKAQSQETAYKAREAALIAREEAIKAKDSEYQSGYISKAALTEDPVGTLLSAGLTWEQVTQAALNQPQMDPGTKAYLAKLEAKIAELEGGQKATKTAIEESQTQAYKQAVAQLKSDATALVNADPAYEAIKATGSINDVVELIERTFKEDGTLMTVEEACRHVEDELSEELYKYSQLEKIKKRFSAGTATAGTAAPKQGIPSPTATQGQKQPQPMKTLTNAHGVSRPLSARERAILAFEGQLKK